MELSIQDFEYGPHTRTFTLKYECNVELTEHIAKGNKIEIVGYRRSVTFQHLRSVSLQKNDNGTSSLWETTYIGVDEDASSYYLHFYINW